jgi:hypothetical protein
MVYCSSGKNIIFYLCHGIRTPDEKIMKLYGAFKNIVADFYKDKGINPIVYNGSYGWVGAISNVFPWLRATLERNVKTDLENIMELTNDKNTRVVIISFSYGTFLTSKALLDAAINVDSWVLFGGVVHCSFDFTGVRGKVNNVFNYCSNDDKVAKHAPWFCDYGNCGAYGFRDSLGNKAMTSEPREQAWSCPNVLNIRDDTKGHSDWFETPEPILKAINEVTKNIKWE